MIRKMLVANDGSKGGERALSAAVDLARRLELPLDMVCVEELPRFPASIDEIVEEEMEDAHRFASVIQRAKALAKSQDVRFEAHVIEGHAVTGIIDFIGEHGFDLLIIGYMGHSALYNRIIGSTTDRLVEYAPCMVLVVK